MCCGAPLIIYLDGNTSVCRQCGVETHGFFHIGIENTSYHAHYEPFYNCGYSRKKRMGHMIESLFFPCASTPDEPVLKSIQFPPHKVDTVQEVCSFLKKLPVADKRYVNLHFYCKLLLSNYKPPVVPKNFFELKKMMFQVSGENRKTSLACHTAVEPDIGIFSVPWFHNPV